MAEINSLPDAAPPPLAATQPRLLAANRRRPDPYNQRLLTRISTPARLGRGLERAPRPRPYRRAWPPSQRTPLPPRRHANAHRTSVAGSIRVADAPRRRAALARPRARLRACCRVARQRAATAAGGSFAGRGWSESMACGRRARAVQGARRPAAPTVGRAAPFSSPSRRGYCRGICGLISAAAAAAQAAAACPALGSANVLGSALCIVAPILD